MSEYYYDSKLNNLDVKDKLIEKDNLKKKTQDQRVCLNSLVSTK